MERLRSQTLTDPKEVIRDNLKFLREYARRLLIEEDDSLVLLEDFKDALMKEFVVLGESLKLTQRDMTMMLLRGILDKCVLY